MIIVSKSAYKKVKAEVIPECTVKWGSRATSLTTAVWVVNNQPYVVLRG